MGQKDKKREGSAAVDRQREELTVRKVPPFDEGCYGNPKIWKEEQEVVYWGAWGRKQLPIVKGARADIGSILEFLEIRMDKDGHPVRDLIGDPQPQTHGWYRCEWKSFDLEQLPTQSTGEFGPKAEWKRAWHGCKLEGLYSIMYRGSLCESCDASQGHRLFDEVPGVYVHKDGTALKAENYVRFTPLCGDGVFWAPNGKSMSTELLASL